MDISSLISWLTENPEFSELFMGLIGFCESFVIIGTFWPSIILLLVAVALNEIGISVLNICLFAGIGSFLGDVLSYYLGISFGPKIKSLNFVKKRENKILKAEDFIKRYGWGAIVIGRFIPAIRPFIPFITGISFMPQKIFLISAFISCILWAISLALILIGIDSIITLFN